MLSVNPCSSVGCSTTKKRRAPCPAAAMKTEKDEALPNFSLGGKYAGEGAGPMTALGSGGAPPAQDLRLLKRRPAPGKHYACSSYGCRLAFPSMQELMDHLKVHYRPTQSLEGKTFQCPTLGCTETFPSMQDLMAHMKVHYKPNRYFKCENCLLRFRTHRSLFKHLHVCSDRASSPAPPPQRAEKPTLPPASTQEKEPTAKPPPEGLPKPPTVIRHTEKEAIATTPGTDTASSLPELPGSLEALPLVPPAPHPFPLLEPNLFGPPTLTRFSGPPPPPPPSSVPFLSYVHPPVPFSLPTAQPRLRPCSPSHGPSASNAVWKKSQGVSVSPLLPCFGSGVTPGHSSNSRIVWEHTRGRYTCMQCPYSTASREEMTLHIEEHRKNAAPAGRMDTDMDFGVSIASFHSKLTPEMENSLYSQL